MDRIFEVKIERARDYATYYVRASDVSTAATLAIQRDAAAPCDPAEKYEGRVALVREFAAVNQWIG